MVTRHFQSYRTKQKKVGDSQVKLCLNCFKNLQKSNTYPSYRILKLYLFLKKYFGLQTFVKQLNDGHYILVIFQ